MWIKKLLYKIYRFSNLFPLWCKLYQFIWEREYLGAIGNILPYSPREVQAMLNLIRWTPDGTKEFGDAVHHPRYLIDILNTIHEKHYQPEGSFDCDDFALFAAVAVGSKYKPQILSVSWSTGFWPWNIKGHAVCLYQYEYGLYGHIGNWGHSTGFLSVDEVVMSILSEAKMADRFVGFTIFKPEQLYLDDKSCKIFI